MPADVRHALNLDEGDTVYCDLDGDELRIRSAKGALKSIQDGLQEYGTDRKSALDKLIAQRREEVDGE